MFSKICRVAMVAVIAAMAWSGSEVQGGVIDGTFRSLVRNITKVSPRVARDMVGELAEKSPSWSRLVGRYGADNVATLARNPQRAQLVEYLGDDAAKALLEHTSVAENILRHCPDTEVSSVLSGMSRKAAQNVGICAQKSALSAADTKTIVLLVRDGGDEAAKKLAKLSPSALDDVLRTAKIAGLGAAGAMLLGTAAVSDSPMDFFENLLAVGEWIVEHPMWSSLILALAVALVGLFPKIVYKVLTWLPLLCWSALKGGWCIIRKWQEVRKSRRVEETQNSSQTFSARK